jgi:tRNA U34 2-thiouridine synthase MnmA/TrmU
MSFSKTKIRVLGLLSGGLDSTLAAKLILDQGIEVYAINVTPHFEHVHRNTQDVQW